MILHRKVFVLSDSQPNVTSEAETARFCTHRAIHLDYRTTVEYTCPVNCNYNRKCILRLPLGAAKTVLNSRWSLKQGSPCKCQHFSFLEIQTGSHLLNSHNTLAVVYSDILHFCCSKFAQKMFQGLHKPTTRCSCTLLPSYTLGEWLHVCKIWRALVTFSR